MWDIWGTTKKKLKSDINIACDHLAGLYVFVTVQAQRRSKEHSRSTSALSGMADEKSEVSQDADHHMSLYSNGFMNSSIGNDPKSVFLSPADPVCGILSAMPSVPSQHVWCQHFQVTSTLRLWSCSRGPHQWPPSRPPSPPSPHTLPPPGWVAHSRTGCTSQHQQFDLSSCSNRGACCIHWHHNAEAAENHKMSFL